MEEAATLLRAVERSLQTVPRNDYEANNAARANADRIARAEELLKDFSGARANELRQRLRDAERSVAQRSAMTLASGGSTINAGNAFSLNFEQEDGADDELVQAQAALDRAAKRKKEKKVTKSGKSKGGKHEQKCEEDMLPAPEEPPAGDMEAASQPQEATVAVPSDSPSPESVSERIVERSEQCSSECIPDVVIGCRGRCAAVADSALATVDFREAALDCDGTECFCRVILYKCVVIALTYGTVVGTLPDTATALLPGAPAQASNGEEDGDGPESGVDADSGDDGVNGKTESEHLEHLSQELVALYEESEAERERANARSPLPTELPPSVARAVRAFSTLPWVVLMCQGGYFAGAVFLQGKCATHKTFQRYIVRKKQGGKQSTNAKDGGGSYGSVGSQIRAVQEVKFNTEVRDLILSWQPYIDAAAIILYAAPGPQNRAVLTDFSRLPPVLSSTGKRVESPVQLRDSRVQSVPMTTHRPTFEEVQRVFETVSKCTILSVAVSPKEAQR